MTIDSARFQKLLSEIKLDQLFNELGWDRPPLKPQTISAGGEEFTLINIAHKRGVAVFRCSPDSSGKVPARPLLLKIEKEAAKLAHEHLLVFADAKESMLIWLWVSRSPGQPTTTRTHTWHKGQSGESLRQKLSQIVWSLEEEEAVTLTDVITGLRNAFDRDSVSKSFFDKFGTQHEAFAEFIEGLSAASDKAWYASLMLNRLMFVYFIQKKGFLDGDENYLANRMTQVQATTGKGKFHSFYRQFLRRLFHEGLGQTKAERNPELTKLIGEVPYLNGGLFSLHELEENNPDIDVPDEAFQHLFGFFDAWDWHLDDRPLSSGREINPDVLGYIFEKYINQKQMGAYYTKEDITEYISKNTVIPHLIEQARKRCMVAFDGKTSVWNLLQADPDSYIYSAMKTGVIDTKGNLVAESALPDFVQAGMKDAKSRMFERRYNLGEAIFHTATGERGTLPTETWREYVERRIRYLSLRDKLVRGEVKAVDDLITLNLDIRQFMQDVIDTASSPDLLRAVWQAIVGRVPEKASEKFRHGITILDPTCGSGAFLFAALGVLEPLYEACLERMEGFVEDAKKLGKVAEADFVKVLAEVDLHPSRRYYIFKSIILHNLFGVDIMAEAVEICKLRLFLKLVSQVDAGRELEPLPDIDFNIRAGNTLVGYATETQFDATNTLASDQTHRDEIKASIGDLADMFDRFREQQTVHGGKVTSDDKRELRDKLSALSLKLDRYLAHDYGIDPHKPKPFTAWRESHLPFHWFAEFYGVMREGGFDVVIGNPPYVEYKDVKKSYTVLGFQSETCGDLYAFSTERSVAIIKPHGRMGLIVPISIFGTDGFEPLQRLVLDAVNPIWVSNFANRPSQLFAGAQKRLTILMGRRSVERTRTIYTAQYYRWKREEFDSLFRSRIAYAEQNSAFRVFPASLEKLGRAVETKAFESLIASRTRLATAVSRAGQSKVYYTRKFGYFLAFLDFVPEVVNSKTGVLTLPSELKELGFDSSESACAVVAVLSSSTFFWFWNVLSDCRNLNRRDLLAFPFDPDRAPDNLRLRLANLGKKYLTKLRSTSKSMIKSGLTIETFEYAQCKPIIDEIDALLAQYFGLNDEALDFIVNYDIKYRVGSVDEEN
ncbi:MAG TPA: hypothetical protein VLC92_14485 [Rhodocyclaceae bacterium]|nr:hypothetical protein [Rhodocyclaceae bacterium]